MLEFRILGPFAVLDGPNGPHVSVAGARQKAFLVLLLVHANEVVARDRLIDELWERPPESPENALHQLVSQVRKQLAAAEARTAIVTRAPGYVLEIDPESVDASRFERQLAAGRAERRAGDAAAAADTLRAALSLWRGPALAELADVPSIRQESARLEEQRLLALEERIEADLELGRATEIVPELETLIAREPLRERFRAQAMLALYRSGRQADALALYRETRKLFVDELGIEPGPALQELEQAILRQDPSLVGPGAPASAPPSHRRKRRLLPVAIVLVAVAIAVAALVAGFTLRDSPAEPAEPALISVPVNSVAVIDPETNGVVDVVPVGSRPLAIAAGAGAIWVVNAGDGTLSKIDLETRRVVDTIGLGTPATDVVVGFGSVWVANGTEGTLTRVDPEAGVVAETLRLRPDVGLVTPAALAVTTGWGSVWVTSAPRSVLRVNPRTGAVATEVPIPVEPFALASGEEAVWVSTGSRRIAQIDPGTNSVVDEISFPSTAFGLAAGMGGLWAAIPYDRARLFDPLTGDVTFDVRVGALPVSVALGEGSVWVTSFEGGVLSRIDPALGHVVATIVIGRGAEDVTVADGAVWVTRNTEVS